MILTLIAMIGVGRWYFQLAHEYNKNTWGFAILGGGLTIVLQLLFGFISGIIAALTGNLQWIEGAGTIIISLIALALTAVVIVILYKLLERKWENDRNNNVTKSELLDN